MNEFTKGEWTVKDGHYPSMVDIKIGECMKITVVLSATDLSWEDGLERQANAHLIATTGTTATKLAEAGYDAVKVLEVLPELVALAGDDEAICEDVGYEVYKLLEQCWGES